MAGEVDRISLYEKPYRFPKFNLDSIEGVLTIAYKFENQEEQTLLLTIIKSCKEIIFSVREDKIIFSCIMVDLGDDGEFIEYRHAIDLVPKGDQLILLSNDTLFLVSMAIVHEIPIIPNSNSDAESLALLYSKAIKFGFDYYDEGETKNVKFDTGRVDTLSPIENFRFLNLSRLWSPGEIALLKYDVELDFERFRNAESTLTALRNAIHDLNELLEIDKRVENDLQKCITKYPILLGLEYGKIMPKHKLGSEYELDYALIKFNGEIDLVEIESANLKIYTKKYNPTKELVHAEQQVQDWFDWIERNNAYGRNKIPTLVSPIGIIIIGRSENLDELSRNKLQRRNILYNGKIKILTYDDVLTKAKVMLEHLERDN